MRSLWRGIVEHVSHTPLTQTKCLRPVRLSIRDPRSSLLLYGKHHRAVSGGAWFSFSPLGPRNRLLLKPPHPKTKEQTKKSASQPFILIGKKKPKLAWPGLYKGPPWHLLSAPSCLASCRWFAIKNRSLWYERKAIISGHLLSAPLFFQSAASTSRTRSALRTAFSSLSSRTRFSSSRSSSCLTRSSSLARALRSLATISLACWNSCMLSSSSSLLIAVTLLSAVFRRSCSRAKSAAS